MERKATETHKVMENQIKILLHSAVDSARAGVGGHFSIEHTLHYAIALPTFAGRKKKYPMLPTLTHPSTNRLVCTLECLPEM